MRMPANVSLSPHDRERTIRRFPILPIRTTAPRPSGVSHLLARTGRFVDFVRQVSRIPVMWTFFVDHF